MAKVLVVPVNGEPYVDDVVGLKGMQSAVGGYIESVTVARHVSIICNEEGMLVGLPRNRFVEDVGSFICGDFLISRYDEEGATVDVTPDDILFYTRKFSLHPNTRKNDAHA